MALTFFSGREISAAPGGFPQLLEGNLSKGYQAFCVVSLSLVCCSEAVHSALSSLAGVIVLCRHVYLNSFLGVPRPPTLPPSWTRFSLFRLMEAQEVSVTYHNSHRW